MEGWADGWLSIHPRDLGQRGEGDDGDEGREEAAPRSELGVAPLLDLGVVVARVLLGQQQQRQEGEAGEPERLGHREGPRVEERALAPRAPLGTHVAVEGEGERGDRGEARQEDAEHRAAAPEPARGLGLGLRLGSGLG